MPGKYDGAKIKLPEGVTPLADDEPFFLLRGQDGIASSAIRAYLNKCFEAGAESHAYAVEKVLLEFEAWQQSNHDRVKMPDSPSVDPEDDDQR